LAAGQHQRRRRTVIADSKVRDVLGARVGCSQSACALRVPNNRSINNPARLSANFMSWRINSSASPLCPANCTTWDEGLKTKRWTVSWIGCLSSCKYVKVYFFKEFVTCLQLIAIVIPFGRHPSASFYLRN
jgi:hypothetical protein